MANFKFKQIPLDEKYIYCEKMEAWGKNTGLLHIPLKVCVAVIFTNKSIYFRQRFVLIKPTLSIPYENITKIETKGRKFSVFYSANGCNEEHLRFEANHKKVNEMVEIIKQQVKDITILNV